MVRWRPRALGRGLGDVQDQSSRVVDLAGEAAACDAAGNLVSRGGFTYGYDKLSRLQTVTNTSGLSHTYLYTADGERISDRDNQTGATTLTIRDLSGKVLRMFVNGTRTKDYVWGNGMLLASVDASSAKRHFHLDHLGSPRLITDTYGTKVATHTYYPFGLEVPGGTADGERMKFTGHEREPYNHDYMHARHYNPTTLRFLTPDLLRGDVHRPQSFNLFAYVGGNPVNYVDPFGLEKLENGQFGEEIVVTAGYSWLPWLELRSLLWSPDREGGGGSQNDPVQCVVRTAPELRAPSQGDMLAAPAPMPWRSPTAFLSYGAFAGLSYAVSGEVGAFIRPWPPDAGVYVTLGAGSGWGAASGVSGGAVRGSSSIVSPQAQGGIASPLLFGANLAFEDQQVVGGSLAERGGFGVYEMVPGPTLWHFAWYDGCYVSQAPQPRRVPASHPSHAPCFVNFVTRDTRRREVRDPRTSPAGARALRPRLGPRRARQPGLRLDPVCSPRSVYGRSHRRSRESGCATGRGARPREPGAAPRPRLPHLTGG